MLINQVKKTNIKAMKIMGTNEETTLFLGDQIFTDVWGANRVGIKSIMVEKINPKEEITNCFEKNS